jgi:hypothetical protein
MKNDSYRDSPAKPPAGANRFGFPPRPKTKGKGPMKSDPFPTPRDSKGAAPFGKPQKRGK